MTTAELQQLVVDYANQYGIDPGVAVAQIARESANFRPDVVFGPYVGGAGERGMAQFTPATWATWGSGPHTNAYDPNLALDAWGKYMTYLLDMFGWDYQKALTAYNGGPGHLTNPSKYGPPSQAALNYGAQLAAAATGGGSSVSVDSTVASTTAATNGGGGNAGAGSSSLPLWLIIGAVGLAVVVYARD